jgi:hypothetical protein
MRVFPRRELDAASTAMTEELRRGARSMSIAAANARAHIVASLG